MRKPSNIEAQNVADLAMINAHVKDMSKVLKGLNDKQKKLKAALMPIIAKYGEAHSADKVITLSESEVRAYTVQASTRVKFNINDRI